MTLYAYTGDVKKLKSIGYTFQKLYARNYKTYHKNDIFMFVVSKMVLEISNLKAEYQVKFIQFILDNKQQPRSFWENDRVVGKHVFNDMPIYYMTSHGNVVHRDDFSKLSYAAKKDYYDMFKDESTSTDDEKHEEYEKSLKLEGGRDPFHFGLELVNQIIALDNLHPLEIV